MADSLSPKAGAKVLLFFDMTKYFHKKMQKKVYFSSKYTKYNIKYLILLLLILNQQPECVRHFLDRNDFDRVAGRVDFLVRGNEY